MVNAVAALVWIKDRKAQILCWEWVLAFGGLIGIEYAMVKGYLNFDWLKQILVWIQGHLG